MSTPPADVTFRSAWLPDSAAISELILDTQLAFSVEQFSAEGEALLRSICSAESIGRYLERGDIYFVAEQANRIVGVIGVRDTHHITHNFVTGTHHGKGISGALWALAREACLAAGNPGEFELRASTFAIGVYESWGFVREGVAEDTGGIISTPMRLEL